MLWLVLAGFETIHFQQAKLSSRRPQLFGFLHLYGRVKEAWRLHAERVMQLARCLSPA